MDRKPAIQTKLENKYKDTILWVLLAISFSLIFGILLRTCFMSDDILCSEIRGYCIDDNRDIFGFTYAMTKNWTDGGRFYPLVWYITYLLFYLTADHRIIYKLILVILDFVAAVCASAFVKSVTEKKELQYYTFWLLTLLSALNYASPTCTWGGIYQTCAIAGWGGVLAWLQYGKNGRRRWLALSLILLEISMLILEVGYFFPLLVFCAVFFEWVKTRRINKKVWPVVALLFGQFAVYMYFSLARKSAGYNGTMLAFDLRNFLITFRLQFLSAIPMTWIISLNPPWAKSLWLEAITGLNIKTVWLYGMAWVLGIYLSIQVARKIKKEWGTGFKLILSGLILWLGPTFLIAISAKYQSSIPISHTPYTLNYIESFGAALVAVGLLYLVGPKVRVLILAAFFVLLGGVILPLQQGFVHQEMDSTRNQYFLGRDTYEAALEKGILDTAEQEGAVLAVDYPRLMCGWHYFSHHLGRSLPNLHLGEEDPATAGENFYIPSVLYDEEAIALLCKADQIEATETERTYWISDITMYSEAVDCQQWLSGAQWPLHMPDGSTVMAAPLEYLSQGQNGMWYLDLGEARITLAELHEMYPRQ